MGNDGNRDPERKFRDLAQEAGRFFVPSAPIDQRQLFAGRIRQLQSLLDMVQTQGQHAIVYGERGVGKTSLVSVCQSVVTSAKMIGIRENCHVGDTFAALWIRAFDSIKVNVERRTIGFRSQASRTIASMASNLPEVPGPRDVVTLLRHLDTKMVFIFDEFDQIAAGDVSQAFADTIKALSDHNTPAKVILVGVGDTVDQLIASHASIERALVQIRMPRMEPDELAEIIATASKQLGMTWEGAATRRVVNLSQGLPHYVHRLGLFATREALAGHSMNVSMENVRKGMREAVDSAAQSLTDAYLTATSSQRKDSLFRRVLLACALCPTKADELGYFRPFSLKRPLKHMGHALDVPAFASHLNKFASEERGSILQKTGSDRQWRYRFRNPLMQPYVILRGLADGDVDVAMVDKALNDE